MSARASRCRRAGWRLWLIEGYGRGRLIIESPDERDSFVLDPRNLKALLGGAGCSQDDLRERCVALGRQLRAGSVRPVTVATGTVPASAVFGTHMNAKAKRLTGTDGARPEAPSVLSRPGVCWRRARAERAAPLIDGAAYFAALAEALEGARHSVFLLGWDLNADLVLDPDRGGETLVALLGRLTARRPELVVRLLIWDWILFYSLDRQLLPQWHFENGRQVRFQLDGHHPAGRLPAREAGGHRRQRRLRGRHRPDIRPLGYAGTSGAGAASRRGRQGETGRPSTT